MLSSSWIFYSDWVDLTLTDASLLCNLPSLPSPALFYRELHWKWDLHESAEPAPYPQEWLKMQCGSCWQLLQWNLGPGHSVHPADQHRQGLLRQKGKSFSSNIVLANCCSIAFIAAFVLERSKVSGESLAWNWHPAKTNLPQMKNGGKMVSFNSSAGDLSNTQDCIPIWSPLGLSPSVQQSYLFTYYMSAYVCD